MKWLIAFLPLVLAGQIIRFFYGQWFRKKPSVSKNMKTLTTGFYIISFLIMTSCSSRVVGIYNPGSLSGKPQSFHVYTTDRKGENTLEKEKFDRQIINIISENLVAKGLKKSSLPDLYVSFIISVHSSEELNQTAYSPFDYRFNYYGYYDPMRFNSRTYKQGVLIIDIRNADNKLVWQGSKSFKLSARNSSTEELLISCREIIAEFDPEQVN